MFVMRYGNYVLCLGCMLPAYSDYGDNKYFTLKIQIAATPLPIVMVIGSNYDIGEFDAISDLYFIIFYIVNTLWIVFSFGYLWVYNEKSAIV